MQIYLYFYYCIHVTVIKKKKKCVGVILFFFFWFSQELLSNLHINFEIILRCNVAKMMNWLLINILWN